MMRSKIRVCLRFGEFSMPPEELSTELGLQPTDSWSKGDPCRVAKKRTFTYNGWELSSGREESADLEAHVNAILHQIAPFKENFRKVAAKYPPMLTCVIYSYDGDRPAIVFERDVVKELADLNALINIDLYIFDDD